MKKLIALLIVASTVLPLAASAATGSGSSERPFSIRIQDKTLYLFGPDGKEIGTGLPAPTVGRMIDVPPYSFQISFGADATGNLCAILTPNPAHPAEIGFTVNGHAVNMDKDSVVTIMVNDLTTDSSTLIARQDEDQTVPAQDSAVDYAALPYQIPSDVQGTTPDLPTGPGQRGTITLAPSAGNPVPPPFNTNKRAQTVLNVMTQPGLTTPF